MVQWVQLDHLVDPLDPKAILDYKVLMEPLDPRAILDYKVLMEPLDRMVFKVFQDHKVMMV
jgi:hypothetical protein